MCGHVNPQAVLVSYLSPESRLPVRHPLRRIKAVADQVVRALSPTFAAMYSAVGRPSIPPERLLKSEVLIAQYSVRSHRLFCERLDTDLLFRWSLDMRLDEPGCEHSTSSQNSERLVAHAVAQRFFDAVVVVARKEGLLSDEYFTVDGTLIEAWASQKSVTKKTDPAPISPVDPGNPTVSFHGERRTNATHQSTTDLEAQLVRKGPGQEAQLRLLRPRTDGESPWVVCGCADCAGHRHRGTRDGVGDAAPPSSTGDSPHTPWSG